MAIDIGISEKHREQIADGLSRVLADSYTLYLKTHNYHWNVTGPMFNTLHLMFEEQYTELATAIDEIAERIRSLGFASPGSFDSFKGLSRLEQPAEVPDADGMLLWLADAQEQVVVTARTAIPVAEQAGDEATVDLLVERMSVHSKRAWMLRAMLDRDQQTVQSAIGELEPVG